MRYYLAAALFMASVTTVLAADTGMLAQQSPNQWRASKLSGVRIYGPDDKSVGKITDLLMGKDGKAQFVVVGVGGFLGIGEKDIAIPFDQVAFSNEPLKPLPNTMGGSAHPEPMPVPASGPAPADGLAPGMPTPASDATGVPTQAALGLPAAADPGPELTPSTAYPDHGRISLTADQLKSAPAFHFAP